jgi:hypothetical protein
MESEFGLGMVCYGQRDLKNAKNHFRQSLKLSEIIGDKGFYIENLIRFAMIYISEERYDLALTNLTICERDAFESEYNEIRLQVYKVYADLYQRQSNQRKKTRYQNKYIILKDSLYNESLTQNLMVIQAEHDQRSNKAAIESQSKVLILKEKIIRKQELLIVFSAISVLLLVTLIAVLYQNSERNRLSGLLLEQKVKERTTELQMSGKLLIQSYQNQKQQVSKTRRDINSLVSTLIGLGAIAPRGKKDPDLEVPLNASISNLLQIVNEAMLTKD